MYNWKCLSGSWIKLLALLSMSMDHFAAFILRANPQMHEALFNIGHTKITAYYLMRLFGRLAFPMFAFLLVEGFVHTKSRKRYGISLLLFALLSELPWNLVHSGTLLYPTQNVFFTLFIGFLGLCAIERYEHSPKELAVSLLTLLATSVFLRADFGISGFGFIIIMYLLRNQRILQAVACSCVLSSRWIAGLAFIPISMYNGKRGFIKGPVLKYAFYLFYPVHLLIIYWIL